LDTDKEERTVTAWTLIKKTNYVPRPVSVSLLGITTGLPFIYFGFNDVISNSSS